MNGMKGTEEDGMREYKYERYEGRRMKEDIQRSENRNTRGKNLTGRVSLGRKAKVDKGRLGMQ